jgi:hypothetical protein
LGIKIPTGTQTGDWIQGRQYWNGTLSDPGTIHPSSTQVGAGALVSKEVNAASAAAQGTTPEKLEAYLQTQRQITPTTAVPTAVTPAGVATTAGVTSASLTMPGAKTAPNILEEQKKLYASSGITDLDTKVTELQASMDAKKAEADKRRAEVNENPFLSEASRVGRIAKIDSLLNDSLQTDNTKLTNLQNQLIAKKADINTQLGLVVQQFNLDKSVLDTNFSMFNSLLSSGALVNANANDINSIASQLGLPFSFIQSAITISAKKNTELKYYEDSNGNVTAVLMDKNTGDALNQTSLGKLAAGTKISGAETKAEQTAKLTQTLESNKNSYGHIPPNVFMGGMEAYVNAGLGTSDQYIRAYWNLTDPQRAVGTGKTPGTFNTDYGFSIDYRNKLSGGL